MGLVVSVRLVKIFKSQLGSGEPCSKRRCWYIPPVWGALGVSNGSKRIVEPSIVRKTSGPLTI